MLATLVSISRTIVELAVDCSTKYSVRSAFVNSGLLYFRGDV